MNFGLADTNDVTGRFHRALKKINRFLASPAEYGGICALYKSGEEGEAAPTAEKQINWKSKYCAVK